MTESDRDGVRHGAIFGRNSSHENHKRRSCFDLQSNLQNSEIFKMHQDGLTVTDGQDMSRCHRSRLFLSSSVSSSPYCTKPMRIITRPQSTDLSLRSSDYFDFESPQTTASFYITPKTPGAEPRPCAARGAEERSIAACPKRGLRLTRSISVLWAVH